jgi:2Fe-2S ferredoxin
MKEIKVAVSCDGQHHQLKTYPNEYRSLMHLIADKLYTEGFGECLGMGKCGTCGVAIVSCRQEPSSYDRNENTTLLRSFTGTENARLSCQLLIDEKMDGLIIKVLS